MSDNNDFLHRMRRSSEGVKNKKPLPKEGDNAGGEGGDEGDEGGGGHGKSLLGFFKRDKLVNLIEKGKIKARAFLPFLNKEGFDHHELEQLPFKKGGAIRAKQAVKPQPKKPKAKKAPAKKGKKPAWKKAKGKSPFAVPLSPYDPKIIGAFRSGFTNVGKTPGAVNMTSHHANPLGYQPAQGASNVQLGMQSDVTIFAAIRNAAFTGKAVEKPGPVKKPPPLKKPPPKPAPKPLPKPAAKK